MKSPISAPNKAGYCKDASKGRVMKSSGPSVPNVSSNAAPKTIVTTAKG